MAEQAPRFGRMAGRERYATLVVALFTELLGRFFAVAFDDIVEAPMGFVERYPLGRFRGGLPEKGQDRNRDNNQNQIALFQGEGHDDTYSPRMKRK